MVYNHNFPETLNWNRNIQNLTVKELEKLQVNAILMSPPCQPFTRVGLEKDCEDVRTSSLFHVLDLISQTCSINYILVENVRGFEKSQTRDRLVSCLESSGFNFKEFLLSPCQFGIPNSRQRYYLIAKKKELPFLFSDSNLENKLPECARQILPKSRHEVLAEDEKRIEFESKSDDNKKCYSLAKILEQNVSDKYLIPLDTLKSRWSVLDIRNKDSVGSCCFTKAYSHYAKGTGSVFCPYSKEKLLETFEKIKTVTDSNGDCSKLLSELKLRYFTPREVSRLMCFPETFDFPKNISDRQRYKLLGNSINVFVVSRLIIILCYDKKSV